mgnify:CR=1 FL=1
MTDAQTRPPAPPTDLLYQRDAALRAFDATVVAVDADARAVALDRTAFYPGGGGQPCDEGTLRSGDGASTWPVASASKVGNVVWHQLGGDGPLPNAGDSVGGELDWDRRYRLMRTHTALHVLCGVVFRDYRSLVTGGNMGVDGARSRSSASTCRRTAAPTWPTPAMSAASASSAPVPRARPTSGWRSCSSIQTIEAVGGRR